MLNRRYPTPWQRKTMWTALTALFVVFIVAVAVGAVWVLANAIAFLQPILIPVAIAGILAYLLDPLVNRVTGEGMGRTKAILLLFLIAFLAIGALLAWLVPIISMQTASAARELPQYTQKAREGIVDLIYRYDRTFGMPGTKSKSHTPTTSFVDWLLGAPVSPARESTSPSPRTSDTPAPRAEEAAAAETIAPTPAKISTAERQRIQDYIQKMLPNLEKKLPYLGDRLWALLQKSIGGFLGVSGFLLSLIMVPIYLFFFLKERPSIQRRWKEYLPLRNSPLKDEVASVIGQINNYIVAYFRGQLLVCLVDGILIGSALTIEGLNFAPLIGLIVVVLTMIPYIGIIICWVPAVLIAALQWGDWWHPAMVTLTFVIIQNLEGMFYAPRIVGNSVGLHPMTVIVSIFLWGLLIGGLLGPILAVPLTATIKVLLARYVWGRRLRDKISDHIETGPVLPEGEIATTR